MEAPKPKGAPGISRSVIILLAGLIIGTTMLAPASADVTSSVSHLWTAHIAPLAKGIFYTKTYTNSNFARKSTLSATGTINKTTNPVNWKKLKGVPSGFADGTDSSGISTAAADARYYTQSSADARYEMPLCKLAAAKPYSYQAPWCAVMDSVVVDTAGAVGAFSSIAVGADGFPIMSYYDTNSADLKVTHCGDESCSSGNTSTSVDTAGQVGYFTSIAIGSDGLPVISHYDTENSDLRITHCGNVACTSGNTSTSVDTANEVGQYTSIAIGADGLPVVSHYDQTNGDLRITHCGNLACTSGNTSTAADTAGGFYTSIAIGADGLPVVSHQGSQNLRVTHCGNAACTSGNTNTVVDTASMSGVNTSIAIGIDGLPVISHHLNTPGQELRVTHCGNAACTSGNTNTSIDPGKFSGHYTSIAIGVDGRPVIAHQDATLSDLRLVHCGNAACTSGNSAAAVDTHASDSLGLFTSIAIGSDGIPVMSHQDSTNSEVRFTRSEVD